MELAACADWAGEQLRNVAGFRAWIHVRELNRRRAEVVDAFDAALMPQRFALREDRTLAPYAVAGGTPLSDYAPVRAALRLLDASSGVISFQEFSELLRMPELHVSIDEAVRAARLESALRGRAPSEASLAAWLALANDTARAIEKPIPGAVPRLSQALELLQATRATQAFSTWVSLWVAGHRGRPVDSKIPLVERGISGRGTLSRAARGLGRSRCGHRQTLARVGAARVAPRRARYGLPAADRCARRLDQRPVNRSVASL